MARAHRGDMDKKWVGVIGGVFAVIAVNPGGYVTAGEVVPVLPITGSRPGAGRPPVGAHPPPPAADSFPPEGRAFYLAVDRPDLADAYLARKSSRIILRVVGAVVLGVGASWLASQGTLCSLRDCSNERREWRGPLLTMVAGSALLVAPSFWKNEPLDGLQRLELWRSTLERRNLSRTGPNAWYPSRTPSP